MRVGLFVPCYVDQMAPEVGLATVAILEELGVEFTYPEEQTCCGQPFLTAGARTEAARLARRYTSIFAQFDYVVTPSGSCAATVRRRLADLDEDPQAGEVGRRTLELCEFLVDVLGASLPGRLDATVGMHMSCHGLRELGLGGASELRCAHREDPARTLLKGLEGLRWADLERPDECCGFGGVFCVRESAVSARMGADRVADHRRAGATIVTSTDVSCLAHLRSTTRPGDGSPEFVHVAELLARRVRP